MAGMKGRRSCVTPLSVKIYIIRPYIYSTRWTPYFAYMSPANTYLYMLRNSIKNFVNSRTRIRFLSRPGCLRAKYPGFSGIRVGTRLCPNLVYASFISFILSRYFHSTSSSPLLLRGAPDFSINTVSKLRR